ncbi:hypothetical protein Nepgr_025621 [Nepenthes gracilis]|uniref:Uncharacterized protein n=1 Tax=Nepenthes gracilis TaxID=150966 RepID=A0AAD3T595_NEPGR|nr:hypothetical protein Nepgr_025621 [Nepenthes gracilis]
MHPGSDAYAYKWTRIQALRNLLAAKPADVIGVCNLNLTHSIVRMTKDDQFTVIFNS